MSGDLSSKLSGKQGIILPACIDKSVLAPFISEPRPLNTSYDFDMFLKGIFDSEAKTLGISPERYEYSCINELYRCNDQILDTHYMIYDPGPGMIRGIVGNFLGERLKKDSGIDLGKLFEQTRFSFDEVLFKFPGVDVGGYGNFHMFLNVLNGHFRDYNLATCYVRQEDDSSFRHGFYDHVGLIEGIPGKGLGPVTAGNVESYPVKKVKENKLYFIDVQGGKLLLAPIASCNWNLNYIDGMEKQDFLEADADEVPVKDREVDTFHFLNGVTPHYMRLHLSEGFERIREYAAKKQLTKNKD